ncbi:hypothetical protein [Mycoplasma sp. 'Moose RK']|uniref:hypothetical protein n=1 Tax=Mycoplasma sp. 'Moose RK' TaxID=2780095 RepID=UPI0018C2F782|nr:hypothetical protein [Mycoplasma sp. 'Moose RK']MBG0731014.1 hypothetical protein [Mycoplasma sp. 'Moose RK']
MNANSKNHWKIKSDLSRLKQNELYPLILEHIPDFSNLPIEKSEKILIEYLVSNNKLDLIPKTNSGFIYTPRNSKYRDNMFSNEKTQKIVKQLSMQIIDLAKNNPIIAEKIKNDAMRFSGWIDKNSYLGLLNEFKKNLDEQNIKPDWYFKNIQYVKVNKELDPEKMSKSQEGLMYSFLTQDINSIEYLYSQYAQANQLLQFTKIFNIAVKSYDNKSALKQDLNQKPQNDFIFNTEKNNTLKIKHKI